MDLFYLSFISVIKIFFLENQNTENTTFLHVKIKVVQFCPVDSHYQNRFLLPNDTRTVKKGRTPPPRTQKVKNRLETARYKQNFLIFLCGGGYLIDLKLWGIIEL